MKIKIDLILLIEKYLENLNKNDEIIKYLFNKTEFYEEKFTNDYREELFRYFAGKLGYYAREKNKLYQYLKNEEIEEINKIQLLK